MLHRGSFFVRSFVSWVDRCLYGARLNKRVRPNSLTLERCEGVSPYGRIWIASMEVLPVQTNWTAWLPAPNPENVLVWLYVDQMEV